MGYILLKPGVDLDNPVIILTYLKLFGRKIKIGEKKYYPQHQQFTQLERTIASLTK